MRVVAERQWGVISHAQLLTAGFTRAEIRRMGERGQLLRLYRGVYALGHRRLTMRGHLHAAQLAAGRGAFLSHRTAAAHRGLRRHPRGVVELTIPAEHTPRREPGLLLHRTTINTDPTQARLDEGLLVATIPRIIVDLAGRERPGEIQRLIRESVHSGRFDLAALRAAIDDHPRRPGTGLARAALRRYLPGSEDRRSWLEAQFQDHVRSDPRLPTPLYNVPMLGYEIDVLWERERAAVLGDLYAILGV